jgi:hypothetical protein
MKVYKPLASLLLPALAIVAAALAQHLLTAAWPGIRGVRSPVVTADSYFGALSLGLLCFVSGAILRRYVGTRLGLACAVLAPSAFMCLFLWAMLGPSLELGARIAWFRPITLFSFVTAILPLLGVALGWSYSGARRPRIVPGHGS